MLKNNELKKILIEIINDKKTPATTKVEALVEYDQILKREKENVKKPLIKPYP